MDNKTKLNEALSYYLVLLDNETGRERSWNKCYEVFSEARDNRPIDDSYMDYLCLHLAWFLASWGMLRNSFLMGHNHTEYSGTRDTSVRAFGNQHSGK